MRIRVNPTFDIETWTLIACDAEFEYSGPIEQVKGGASKAEQASADAMQKQELDLMQKQLGLQQGQIAGVNAVVDPMIAEGGMAPSEESALTSLAINQLPADFRQTAGAINQNLAARGISGGSSGAGSGDIARNFGSLGAQEDYMKSTALSNIQLEKARQLQGLLGIKMGVAGMYGNNTGMFNRGASDALSSGVTAAHNVDMAGTSFLGPIIGGVLGAAGSAAMPGGAITKSIGCWIAEAIYGTEDIRTHIVRFWLNTSFKQSTVGRVVMWLYMRFGQRIAGAVRHSVWLKRAFRPLFDLALNKAMREPFHGRR